jgi:hypothetical protein
MDVNVDDGDTVEYDPTRPVAGKAGAVMAAGASREGAAGVPFPAGEEEDWHDGNDDQRRLQEIGAIDDDDEAEVNDHESDDDDHQSDPDTDIDALDDEALVERALDEAEGWSWQLTLPERQRAVSRLVRLMVGWFSSCSFSCLQCTLIYLNILCLQR